MRGCDGLADVRVWRRCGEFDLISSARDAELLPQFFQIHMDGRCLPGGVLRGEHMCTGGFVADFEGAGNGPVLIDGASAIDDRAEGVLQAFAVASGDADLDIRDEAEERAAPIGAAPGASAIE